MSPQKLMYKGLVAGAMVVSGISRRQDLEKGRDVIFGNTLRALGDFGTLAPPSLSLCIPAMR
jgi:hypothetical protein